MGCPPPRPPNPSACSSQAPAPAPCSHPSWAPHALGSYSQVRGPGVGAARGSGGLWLSAELSVEPHQTVQRSSEDPSGPGEGEALLGSPEEEWGGWGGARFRGS